MDIIDGIKNIADDKRNLSGAKEIIMNNFITDELSSYFTIVPFIKGGQQVASIGVTEKITTKDAGCDTTPIDINSALGKFYTQTWNPQRCSVNLSMCYKDFESSFLQWGLNNGTSASDLTDTELLAFILDAILDGLKRDILRISMLANKDVATLNILKEASNVQHYDMLDKGVIATLEYFSTLTELSNLKTTLDANSKTTFAAQTTLNSDYALNIFKNLTDVNFAGDIILVSNQMYRNYKDTVRNFGHLESGKVQLTNGVQSLSFEGVPVIPVKHFDNWSQQDFHNGTKYHLPHFALFTNKTNMMLGIDEVDSLTDLRIEHIGGKENKVYIKGSVPIDFKIGDPTTVKYAI